MKEEYKGYKIYKREGLLKPYIVILRKVNKNELLSAQCSSLFVAKNIINWYIKEIEEKEIKEKILKDLGKIN